MTVTTPVSFMNLACSCEDYIINGGLLTHFVWRTLELGR